jgi:DUF1009 family protein
MTGKLGILAGGGSLPNLIIKACRQSGRELFVVAFEGQADADLVAGVPHAWVRLGDAGKTLKLLKCASVEELILVGRIARPTMAALRPDAKALEFFAKMGTKVFGDDALLRALAATLEAEGFAVTSPTAILSDLHVEEGVLGTVGPDESAELDVSRGIEVLSALSPVDVGQAAAVQEGLVLGVEAVEGTDALIERCGLLKREGPGPVLVKIRKLGQDTRVDLPTVGLATVKLARDAGFRGIAIEARATLVLEQEHAIAAANKAGMFVIAVTVPAGAAIVEK